VNPIFSWIITHTVARSLARRCPRCGLEQVVPKEKARLTVPCQRCGAPIPAKKG
jgi:ribosomal protein S27E